MAIESFDASSRVHDPLDGTVTLACWQRKVMLDEKVTFEIG